MFSRDIKFWTEKRVSFILRAAVLFLFCSVALLALTEKGQEISIGKGDFPVFYTGAYVAYHDDASCLYDLSCNKAFQNRIWPGLRGGVHPFVYPAFVAVLLAPLGALSPELAHAVFVLLMLICFVAALYLQRRFIPYLREKFLNSLCLLLLFAPLTFGILGAQNTALSLLCFSAFTLLAYQKCSAKEWFAGAALGLWLFKPHYPLIVLWFMLIARRWRVVCGFLIPAIAYYILGAWKFGLEWPLQWYFALKHYLPAEMKHNSYNMVSLNGVLNLLTLVPDASRTWSPLCFASLSITLLFVGGLSWLFLTNEGEVNRDKKEEDYLNLLYLIAPVLVLASLHTHFYDVSLCLFPLLRYQKLKSDLAISVALTIFLMIYAVSSQRMIFTAAPLVIIPLYTLFLVPGFWDKRK